MENDYKRGLLHGALFGMGVIMLIAAFLSCAPRPVLYYDSAREDCDQGKYRCVDLRSVK